VAFFFMKLIFVGLFLYLRNLKGVCFEFYDCIAFLRGIFLLVMEVRWLCVRSVVLLVWCLSFALCQLRRMSCLVSLYNYRL